MLQYVLLSIHVWHRAGNGGESCELGYLGRTVTSLPDPGRDSSHPLGSHPLGCPLNVGSLERPRATRFIFARIQSNTKVKICSKCMISHTSEMFAVCARRCFFIVLAKIAMLGTSSRVC